MRSAGINFGIPESEWILEVEEDGSSPRCWNPVTGEELGGGGETENVELVITNGAVSDSIWLPDYFDSGYPTIINNALQTAFIGEVSVDAQESHTLNIAVSSVPTEIIMIPNDDEPVGSGNVVVTYDEEEDLYKLSITGDCAITIVPVG